MREEGLDLGCVELLYFAVAFIFFKYSSEFVVF